MPVPVGSPPWITKPGTIRWKRVPSKNFLRTSDANEAVVQGESFTSSVNANVPRFVFVVTVYVFAGSSRGSFTGLPLTGQLPAALGRVVGGGASVVVGSALWPPPPQPASAAAATTISGSPAA